jgi:hypothetical protein
MNSAVPLPQPSVECFETSVRVTSAQRSLTVVFDYPVREVLVSDESIIVRVEPPPGTILNQNVFGLTLEGERLWTIGQLPHVYEDSPYTGLSKRPDGAILEIVMGK